MKYSFTAIVLFTSMLISCSSIEKSAAPTPPSSFPTYEPITLAESIEEDPDIAQNYHWIDESRHDDIWKIVDEFPDLVKGLQFFHVDLVRSMLIDPNLSCMNYSGERVLFSFVINEKGNVAQVHSQSEESACHDLIKGKIKEMIYTPATVDGESVSVLFNIPITIQI